MAENDLGIKQISNATLEVCGDFEGGPLVFNVRASVLPPQDLFIVYVDGVAAAQLADVNEFDELGLELGPGPHIVDFSYQYNIFSLDPDSPELVNIPSKILGAVWIDFVQLGDVAPLPTYSPTKSDVVTNSPTVQPTPSPTISFKPSAEVFPSISPSVSMMPTNVTITTNSPSYEPSLSPTNSSEPSSAPSFMPSTSLKPSISLEPSISAKPSGTLPTVKPTADPTQQPSTLEPTLDPTVEPTPQPTLDPTLEPVSSLNTSSNLILLLSLPLSVCMQ